MNYIISDGELYHYGVKGMKWGKRKARMDTKMGLRKARRSFVDDMKKLKSEGHANNMDAIKKRALQYNSERKSIKDNYKQIKQVSKGKHEQQKQYGNLEDALIYKKNVKKKDLQKAYGRLEGAMSYSKRSNEKANRFAEKAIAELDKQLSLTGKKPTYDVKKVNDFIDKALAAIDKDLERYRV